MCLVVVVLLALRKHVHGGQQNSLQITLFQRFKVFENAHVGTVRWAARRVTIVRHLDV